MSDSYDLLFGDDDDLTIDTGIDPLDTEEEEDDLSYLDDTILMDDEVFTEQPAAPQEEIGKSYIYNEGVDPATRTKSLDIQRDTEQREGYIWPVEDIEQNLPAAQSHLDYQNMIDGIDWGQVPVTASILADPAIGPVFYGDAKGIANLEKTVEATIPEPSFMPVQNYLHGYWNARRNLLYDELLDGDRITAEEQEAYLEAYRRTQELPPTEWGPEWDNMAGKVARFGMGFFTEPFVQWGMMFGRGQETAESVGENYNPFAGIGDRAGVVSTEMFNTMWRQEYASYFEELSQERDDMGNPYDPEFVKARAATYATISLGIETFGDAALGWVAGVNPVTKAALKMPKGVLKKIAKKGVDQMAETPAGKKLIWETAKLWGVSQLTEGSQELAQQVTQDVITNTVRNTGGEVELLSIGDIFGRGAHAFGKGMQGGGLTQVVQSSPYMILRYHADKANTERIESIRDAVTGSIPDSKETSPNQFNQVVEQIVNEKGASIYMGVEVNAFKKYMEAVDMTMEQLREISPVAADSLEKVERTGGYVDIPTSQFFTTFVNSEQFNETVMDDVKFHDEMPTLNEAKEIQSKLEEIKENPEYDKVYETFHSRLLEVHDPQQADAEAQLLSHVFLTLGKEANLTEDQMMDKYYWKVVNQNQELAELETMVMQVQNDMEPTDADIYGLSLQEFVEAGGTIDEAVQQGFVAEDIAQEEYDSLVAGEPVYREEMANEKLLKRREGIAQLKEDAERMGIDMTQSPKDIAHQISRRLEQAAGWAEERVTKIVDEFDQKGVVAWVHPNDFIRATTGGPEGFAAIQEETTDTDIERVRGYDDVPTLWVDEETGEIVGHEGRHRMSSLFASGARKVPVVVNYRSRGERAAGANLRLTGQNFGTTRGMDIDVSDTTPISWENREQIASMMQEEGRMLFQTEMDWSSWEPTVTSTGKIMGAPAWVTDQNSLEEMRAEIAKLNDEGEVGRYWYEDSAKAVLEAVGGNVQDAERLIQLIAIYSPQANVEVNTYFAISAWNQWKEGVSREDFKVKTEDQDNKARVVLYDGGQFPGRKTSSFYLNLIKWIHDNVEGAPEQLNLDDELRDRISSAATIDMWMYRAFGYANEAAGDDKGTGAYSFAENETRRLAAQLGWEPWQVQAAIWTAMKSRYEDATVKAATWERSISEGYATLDEDGKKQLPTTAEGMRQHRRIWREEAMKLPSDKAVANAERDNADFSDFIQKTTFSITWEALPSESLGLDIFDASPEVQQLFTSEAKGLLVDEDGVDLLAQQLGVHLGFIEAGAGGYAGNVTPNNLSHIVPTKTAGEFNREHARAYARAIQYIFKQDAVPWFRADPRALSTKSGQAEMKFRVVNSETGRTVPRSKVDTLAEAQAIAEKKGDGFEVRGGKFSRGTVLTFSNSLSGQMLQNVLNLMSQHMGEDVGFTVTSPNEISLINFRDDETGVPFVDDEEFFDAAQRFIDENSETLGIESASDLYTEGEYGYVHDWESDTQGEASLDYGILAGQQDLQAWIRDRRSALEEVLERYSGENLKLRQQEADQRQRVETLWQESKEEGVRGFIQMSEARDYFKISLTGQANLSTFLHESGHMFLEMMADLASQEETSQKLKDDLNIIKQWVGWEEGQTRFTTEQHEKWARAFEAYLMKGKAPSVELQSAFRRFASWLTGIYGMIKNLGVDLNDDITGVMDRMIATEESIQTMAEMREYKPAFENAEAAGMTDEEWSNYTDSFAEAMSSAEEVMRTRLMKEIDRENRKKYRATKKRINKEVSESVANRPVYRAIRYLRTGQLDDTNDIPPALQGDKLDAKVVKRTLKARPEVHRKLPRGIKKKGGDLDPDKVAAHFDYKTGAEMLVAMAEAENEKALVKRLTEQAVDELFGSLMEDQNKLAEAAAEALHNNKIEKFHTQELRKLSGKANRPLPVRFIENARAFARGEIASKTVRELRSTFRYQQAEQRAIKEMQDAVSRNDWGAAADAKQRQIINFLLYREAVKAKEEITKIHNYIVPFTRLEKRKKLGLAGPHYRDSMDQLLEGVELKTISGKAIDRRKTLQENLDYLENSKGQNVIVADQLRQEAQLVNYQTMTLEAFRTLRDAVKNIETLARNADMLITEQRQMEKKIIQDAMVAAIYETRAVKGERTMYDDGVLDKVKAKLKTHDAELLKMEFLFKQLDAQTYGIWQQFIFEPMATAQKKAWDMKQQLHKDFITPMLNLPTEQVERLKQQHVVQGVEGKMTGFNVIAMALNMGNQSNIDKMVRGQNEYLGTNWTEESVMAQIDNILTKQDWELVQFIWDQVDQYWDQLAAVSERTTGVKPPKVERKTVKSKHGTFDGGYYPIITDKRATAQARRREDASDLMKAEANLMFNNAAHGFTKERTNDAKPLLFDFSKVGSHMGEVIHYITHYEAIDQAYQLIRSPRIENAFSDTGGVEYYKQLKPWLQHIANNGQTPEQMSTMNQMFNHMATGVSIATMGANLGTVAVQPLGLTSTLRAVGWSNTIAGFVQWVRGDNQQAWQDSNELPQSKEVIDRETARDLKEVFLRYQRAGKLKAGMKSLIQMGWWMLVNVQQQINYITYHAAYRQAVNDMDLGQKDAIMHADSIVRTAQTAAAPKDVAAIQRQDGIMRTVVAFYSYLSALYGQTREDFRQVTGRMITGVPTSGTAKLRGFTNILTTLYLTALIEKAIKDGLPDEEEPPPEWLMNAFKNGTLWGLATMPLAKIPAGFFSDYPFRLAPVDSLLQGMIYSGKKLLDPEKGLEEMTVNDWKKLSRGITVLSPYRAPLELAFDLAQWWEKHQSGELEEPVRELIFGVKR